MWWVRSDIGGGLELEFGQRSNVVTSVTLVEGVGVDRSEEFGCEW